MDQIQFDQLLSWAMLSALSGAVLERQRILGRDLTEDEYKQCHLDTHRHAELIQEQLQINRELFRT